MAMCRHSIYTRRTSLYGGFTLIELIVVMLLVAIMSLIAIPVMNSMSDSRNGVAARTLLRGMTQARQQAVATGVRTWVIFDEAAETWSVLVEDPLTPGRLNAAVMTAPSWPSSTTGSQPPSRSHTRTVQ